MSKTPTSSPTVGRAVARGSAWMIATRLMVRGIGVVSTIILARLLIPEDFGLVAMASLVVFLMEMLGDFGFELPLINKARPSREEYNTAWTLNIFRGLVIFALSCLLAPTAASFFDEPRLSGLLPWVSVMAVLTGLDNIGIVDWRKEMRFEMEFKHRGSIKLVSFVATLVAALLLRSYWALVIGILAGRIWGLFFTYWRSPYRPGFSLKHWHEFFDFGKWIMFQGIFSFLRTRGDVLIIGKVLGASSVGLYALAFEISNMVTSELLAPMRRALLPGYAQISDDKAALRRVFRQTLGLTALIGVPVAIGLGLTADALIRLLLNANWLQTIPLIELLVGFGLISLLTSATSPLTIALNRPQLLTWTSAAAALTLLLTMPLALSRFGLEGAAYALIATQAVTAVIELAISRRLIDLSLRKVVQELWRPFLAGALMAAVVIFVARSVEVLALHLLIEIFTGAIVYPVAVLILWHLSGRPEGAESAIIDFITEQFRGKKIASAE